MIRLESVEISKSILSMLEERPGKKKSLTHASFFLTSRLEYMRGHKMCLDSDSGEALVTNEVESKGFSN